MKVPFAQRLAGEIAAVDPPAVQAINSTYRDVAATTLGEGVELERQRFAGWKLAPADVEARRQAVIDRGRSKLG
jgi:enoyl-CoA hydratase/carnithine racemase